MPQNCPQILATGSCSDPRCPFNHNILSCEPCGFVATSPHMYKAHMGGKKHRNRASGLGAEIFCPICEKNMSLSSWAQHKAGRSHRNTAARKGVPAEVELTEGASLPGRVYCDLCQVSIVQDSWAHHVQNIKHRNRELYAAYRSALGEAEKEKNGATVEGAFDFDIMAPADAKIGRVTSCNITTTVASSKISLVRTELVSSKGRRPTASPFSATIQGENRSVTYGRNIALDITFRQAHIGRYEDRIEIIFEDMILKKQFIISRSLRAIVGSISDHQNLRPKAPFIPRPRTDRQVETNIVEGDPPPALNAVPYIGRLPRAPIPKDLSTLLSTGSFKETLGRVRRVYLPATLNSSGYGKYFKALLWIEEFRMERDLERYDIPNAKLRRHESYYYLEVPGLAEKRPSVLVGDRILVQKHGAATGHWFEGHVHVAHREEVGLRFHGSFSGWSPTQLYNIHFKLNRIPLRRQHQALDSVFTEDRVLFPLEDHVPGTAYPRQQNVRLNVFNPLVGANPPQLQAVVSIVKRAPGSVPFVIFGPPGTGKTITMVESILQVLEANPSAKILVCAPSNSASDLLTQRLSALTPQELFRFYAPSRFKSQVPDGLLSFTYVRPDGHFSVPPLATMKRYRVTVTTCVSASVASGIGIPRGHYSHIFIDEAGQATETEAMVSIKAMADSSTNVVLSGDPKQLGPIIRSSIARELGFETSFVERLMRREIYDEVGGYGKSVVKLVKNYRSHEAILRFPNDRFYGGDLQPCGDPQVVNSYLRSSHLPNKKFPIVFHALSGKDDREASSPSFFNIDEVTQVKAYVEALRHDRQFRITDKEIGIIAPYHAQCQKIRATLRAVADGVKVGSVEEFQGQERRVIIISTVRSSKEFVEYDLKHTLGFVANPRRFNVAVTRAQALLIIVGDPQVLSLDPLWRSFLNYVHLNGGWTGPPIGWDPHASVNEGGGYDVAARTAAQEDMDEFARRMEAVTLAGIDDNDEAGDANVDRPWRDVE